MFVRDASDQKLRDLIDGVVEGQMSLLDRSPSQYVTPGHTDLEGLGS